MRWRKTRIGWRTIWRRWSARRTPLQRKAPLENLSRMRLSPESRRVFFAASARPSSCNGTPFQRISARTLRCRRLNGGRAEISRAQRTDCPLLHEHEDEESVADSVSKPNMTKGMPRDTSAQYRSDSRACTEVSAFISPGSMKFVIVFLPRTEIRATRATASRISPENMNGSRVKAILRLRSAFSPEAIGRPLVGPIF